MSNSTEKISALFLYSIQRKNSQIGCFLILLIKSLRLRAASDLRLPFTEGFFFHRIHRLRVS